MADLIDLADRKNKVIRLTPATKDKNFGTTSRKRLINFYKRFGFYPGTLELRQKTTAR